MREIKPDPGKRLQITIASAEGGYTFDIEDIVIIEDGIARWRTTFTRMWAPWTSVGFIEERDA